MSKKAARVEGEKNISPKWKRRVLLTVKFFLSSI